MKRKSKNSKVILKMFLCLILIIAVINSILFSMKLLYKINNNNNSLDVIVAEDDKIHLGEESVFYVDLTSSPNNYKKINKIKEEVYTSQEQSKEEVPAETKVVEQEPKTQEQQGNGQEQPLKSEEKTEQELTSESDTNQEIMAVSTEEQNKIIEQKDNLNQVENKTNDSDEEEFSTNTIIVKTSHLAEIENGGKISYIVKIANNIYCMHYNNPKDTKEGYEILTNNELVEEVYKDSKIETQEEDVYTEITNENTAWGVSTTNLLQYKYKLKFENNNQEVKVAVVDTGIRATHEVFKDKEVSDRLDLTHAYNYADNNENVEDNNGHGTKVAGIIAESTPSNVKIVPIKVLDADEGDMSKLFEALAAIKGYADVVNISLGAYTQDIEPENLQQVWDAVIKELYDSGTVVVCAAGNAEASESGRNEVQYPAKSEYTVAVSSINNSNELSTFSNYGEQVDFAAPGEGLVLPVRDGDDKYSKDYSPETEQYKNSGTSFAAPFCSAAMALIKSENINYTVEEAKTILSQNCEDLGDPGKDEKYGYGGINFGANMFKNPVIIIPNNGDTSNWVHSNELDIYAIGSNKIKEYIYTNTEQIQEGAEWTALSKNAIIVNLKLTVDENKQFYISFKDEKDSVTNKMITVSNIDKNNPTVTKQIEAYDIGTTGFKVKLSTQDLESGISKIVWHYKKSTDTEFNQVVENYSKVTDTAVQEKMYQFSNFGLNTTYTVYAEIYDLAGNSITTNQINVTTLEKEPEDQNVAGGENTAGENNTGENVTDENTAGENTAGENTAGENTAGGNTAGENTAGENTAGGNTAGGNTAGGNTAGGNTADGNTAGGNTAGGNTAGGNTAGGNTAGGNTADGNINRGNIAGVGTNGGNTNNNGNNIVVTGGSDENLASANVLPHTGTGKVITISIIVILLSGVFAFIKYIKLKEIE